MESISNEKFRQSCGKSLIVLVVICIYCIYSFFNYGYDSLNTLTFIASILSILGIRRISIIGGKAIVDSDYKIGAFDSVILNQILIFLLGILSIYIFTYKGLYGLYKSFGNLSFISVIYRFGIIIASYQLLSATSKIQGVLQAIKSNNIKRN